jgi:hypothetical protein
MQTDNVILCKIKNKFVITSWKHIEELCINKWKMSLEKPTTYNSNYLKVYRKQNYCDCKTTSGC